MLEYCLNGDILLAANSLVGENILNDGCSLVGDIALSCDGDRTPRPGTLLV